MKTINISNAKNWLLLGIFIYAAIALSLTAFAQGDKKETLQGDYVKGAAIWASACIRCHNMRDPKELTDKQWKPVVSHMRLRGGLTGQDARDVLAFLQQSNNK